MIHNGYDYPDSCTISISTGDVDLLGGEVMDVLFSGDCELQYGSSGSTALQGSQFQSNPTLFIPEPNVDRLSIDCFVVVVSNGRTINYSIEQYESSPDFNDTCIWLKGGVND